MKRIERQIVNVIKKATRKNWYREGASNWTRIYKKALSRLGQRHGYKIYGIKKVKSAEGEWLYDLCWAKENRSGGVRLGLIAEIEWHYNKDSILEDFSKLTVGVADYRLLITWHSEQGKKAEKWASSIVRMCKRACPSKRGFRYLLIITPKYDYHKVVVAQWTK